MSAGTYNITIEQGATFTLNLSYKDSAGDVVQLVAGNYTAAMKIKESHGGNLIASSVSGDANNTLSIALANTGNNIIVTMSAINTALLDFNNALYDIEVGSGNSVDRILEGSVKLSKEITA